MYQTKQSATADCTRKVKVWVSRLKVEKGKKVEETTNISGSFYQYFTLLSLDIIRR